MKQTAVEWLVNSLSELEHKSHLYKLIDYRIKKQKLIDQAKQMEKEQMIGFAKNFEHIDINKSDIENELNCYLNLEDTEELLKEPFKSE